MRRYQWYCHRCGGALSRPRGTGLPTPAEALRVGLVHYELVHRDADTAAMAVPA